MILGVGCKFLGKKNSEARVCSGDFFGCVRNKLHAQPWNFTSRCVACISTNAYWRTLLQLYLYQHWFFILIFHSYIVLITYKLISLDWLTCKVILFAIEDNDYLIVLIQYLISLSAICNSLLSLCQNLIFRILN